MRWCCFRVQPVLAALGSCALMSSLAACGDDPKAQPDAMVDGAPVSVDATPDGPSSSVPPTLADTGLCVDAGCTQIATGVYAYTPRFQLWSDTAAKRRWIYLPPGTQIDTSDMDHWEFPVGTKLWKEFTRDNVRVETRLTMRIGSGDTMNDWVYASYVWNSTQDATTWAEFGEQNANGTAHDVPSKFLCRQCHENNKPSRVIGFSAIQLDFDGATGEIDLADAIANGWLSSPPTAPASGPYFPLPATTNTYAHDALGYMHANCGHCHNPNSQVINNTLVHLRLTTTTLSAITATPAYTTTVGVTGNGIGGRTTIVVPGQPNQSILSYRFNSTNLAERMPAAGTEDIDPTAATLLDNWISDLN